MSDWFVGQRIVCIRPRKWWLTSLTLWDVWRCLRAGFLTPREGKIYLIAAIVACPNDLYFRIGAAPRFMTFRQSGFRPLVGSRNDIGELQRLLETLPERVD